MQRDEQVTTLFQSFLAKTDRKAVKMKPDGNCFYRAISYELFGTEEEDSTIRSVISRTERLNKDVFWTFLMPAGSMEEHCIGVGIGVGTGGARGAMAPTEFIKCILAPPLFTSHAAI